MSIPTRRSLTEALAAHQLHATPYGRNGNLYIVFHGEHWVQGDKSLHELWLYIWRLERDMATLEPTQEEDE